MWMLLKQQICTFVFWKQKQSLYTGGTSGSPKVTEISPESLTSVKVSAG